MRSSLILKLSLLLTLTTCYLLLAIPSFAQSLSLSISPPLLEVVIKPGKSILVAYNIQNSGDPVVLTPKVVSFEPADERGNIRLK